MNAVVTEFSVAATEAFAPEVEDKQDLSGLGHRLLGEFAKAQVDRQETEERWLMDLRQYRGQYDPKELADMSPRRSKAFVRKTRVKVKTVNSRVADLLFPAGSDKNWEIGPTPVPNVSRETIEKVRELLKIAMNPPAGQPLQPGQPAPEVINPTKEEIKAAILESAKKSAGNMSKAIDDQLTESRYKDASVKTIHSGNLYGTGIIKGPLVERKIRTRFAQNADGKWVMKSETYVVPFVECVSLWRFYPDMSATTIDQCRYTYELHRMTKAAFGDLSKRKSFDNRKIVDYIKANPRGAATDAYFESDIKQMGDRVAKQGQDSNDNQYDVLERWGWVDGCDLKEAGVTVPANREHESFFMNIWLLPNGEIIRAALQPINGVTWPYHMYYFDKDETSIFGEGLGSIMRDDQKMLNAAVRMILDNAALTSGPMLEVIVGNLASTEKADEIYPWKVWLRNNNAPGSPAVRSIELPNSIAQLTSIAQMFENNADETTAIPRYMSGENVASGAAATASGMSMLMGAANIVIKDLITAWDEGITRPFLEALYRWNMQFNTDPDIKGDFEVKARGTASLVAKEVRAAALDMFSAATANPQDAPYIKRDVLLRQRAEAHELAGVVKTEDEVKADADSEEAKAQAQMIKDLAAAQIAEAQGKAAKLMAEAELTKNKMNEMMANVKLIMANIDGVVAKTVETRVKAAYAALQAGGVATNSPYVAPAGDEILKSAGWVDVNGEPSLADLNRQPVQENAGTEQLVNKGAGFVEQPRATTNEVPIADPNQPQVEPAAPGLQPQTGQLGVNGGIETQRIEQ